VEAATATERDDSAPRELAGEKAARIVEAMRISVAERGIGGATFDHVAREAGVSRGLLHYYFGTKERLLVEVVRRECDVRIERLSDAVAAAIGGDDVLRALVSTFADFLGEGPAHVVMFNEMMTLAQRNTEIAAELDALCRRTRGHLAALLKDKQDEGKLELRADPDTAAQFLFVLADGITIRRLTEPELDITPLMKQAVRAGRQLFA
jgi:AcrR family transcriptional regulator